MILTIPNVLSPAALAEARDALESAPWEDGAGTAGHQASLVKRNRQLPSGDPVAVRLGAAIVRALGNHPLFVSAALPLHVLPPMFNRYEGGGEYGTHVDGAIRRMPGLDRTIRTDVSCTLFFADPEEYDGGELVIEDTYGAHSVKLPAGHAVIYPSTSLHRVNPVTRGRRIASFMWIQSLVRDDQRRAMLFDLDCAIRDLGMERAGDAPAVTLTGIYHNLLRQWAET